MARWADKATATLTGTESIPCTQSGVDKKTSPQALADFPESKSSDIASASTTDLSTVTTPFAHVTGTTTITALGTMQAGTRRRLVFDGILTLTHNGTSLILPGAANITTAAGDVALMVSEGSGNWRCVGYQRANGSAITAGVANPSINSTVTSNTITPTGTNDLLRASGLSAGLTIANPAATPADGWGLVAELKDDGTTRTLTWGSKYASRCATLPTATTAGKQHLVGLSYNATDDKYYCDFALVQP